MLRRSAITIALLAFLLECGPTPYTAPQLVGSYKLTYDDGRVELLVLSNGSMFCQNFQGATHVGRWEYVVKFGTGHVLLHRQQIFVATWAVPAGEIHGDLYVARTPRGPELVFNENMGWSYMKIDTRTLPPATSSVALQ